MTEKFNAVLTAVILGVFLYLVDSMFFYLLGNGEHSILYSIFPSGSISELYSRLLMFTGLVVFGIFVNGKFNEFLFERTSLQNHFSKMIQGHFDFKFLSSLSFQLRTPLNVIIGFSELFKNSDISPDTKKVYLEHINSSSKYMLMLINNLSEISKIESNELSINRTETDLNKILDELDKVFLIRRKEINKSEIPLIIEKKYNEGKLIVLTDPERLKHVLINLLENAYYQTETGAVYFGFNIKDEKYIEFFVRDTSYSFSQDKLESVFERYNKLTNKDNLPFDGPLLRLAISKSIVKLLGGEIWADSKPVSGSTIYFTIPYLKVNNPNVELLRKIIVPSIKLDWSSRIIMIAEDIDSNFIYLNELLRPTNIRIIHARNGKEALDHAKKNSGIELILTDILMPEMDGYEAAREIKKINAILPIIAQTAFAIEGMREEDRKNFDGYLIKPIWAHQLLPMLEKYFT